VSEAAVRREYTSGGHSPGYSPASKLHIASLQRVAALGDICRPLLAAGIGQTQGVCEAKSGVIRDVAQAGGYGGNPR
jgi:hypothetical protein